MLSPVEQQARNLDGVAAADVVVSESIEEILFFCMMSGNFPFGSGVAASTENICSGGVFSIEQQELFLNLGGEAASGTGGEAASGFGAAESMEEDLSFCSMPGSFAGAEVAFDGDSAADAALSFCRMSGFEISEAKDDHLWLERRLR